MFGFADTKPRNALGINHVARRQRHERSSTLLRSHFSQRTRPWTRNASARSVLARFIKDTLPRCRLSRNTARSRRRAPSLPKADRAAAPGSGRNRPVTISSAASAVRRANDEPEECVCSGLRSRRTLNRTSCTVPRTHHDACVLSSQTDHKSQAAKRGSLGHMTPRHKPTLHGRVSH